MGEYLPIRDMDWTTVADCLLKSTESWMIPQGRNMTMVVSHSHSHLAFFFFSSRDIVAGSATDKGKPRTLDVMPTGRRL